VTARPCERIVAIVGTSPPGEMASSNGQRPGAPARSPVDAKSGRRPLGWIWLAILFEVWFGTFVAADRMHGMPALLVLVGGFVALGLAGWRWGADSRDGQDWGPNRHP
jgi:hypothetical protein